MDEDLALPMAAASSECSSGCQSGWTTYLHDHSSSCCSRGTARPLHGRAQQPYHHHHHQVHHGEYSEDDDLSMISDASSGPRQQSSAGNDADAAAHANAESTRRRDEAAAAARRRSKRAAAASLLEDTASSPAFFAYSKAMTSGDANGYAYVDAPMMEVTTSAGFSCDFSATTGFKSSLMMNGTPLGGGYLQMHYSPAPVEPMPTRQACRDGAEQKRW